MPQILNYDLYFKVNPMGNFFNVSGTLNIFNEMNTELSKFDVLLYHNLKVKSIKDIYNTNLNFAQQIIFLEDEKNYYVNLVSIDLGIVLKSKKQTELSIEYEGTINGYSHLMAYIKDKVDKDFSILRPDSHVYPIIAKPCFKSIIESYRNTFTYNLFIEVPQKYTVACGGMLKEVLRTSESSIFHYASRLPTWRFDIAIAQYSLVEDNSMNLRIFVFDKHKDNARNTVKAEVKRAFDLFTNLFGKYQEDRYFTVIEIKESYGSQAGDNYVMMEEHGFSGSIEELTHLYHEIGHAWNVKAKKDVQRTRFFDEAFACYFEAIAIKKFYGYDAFIDKMETYRKLYVESVEDDEINLYTPICDYGKYEIGHNSYTKGAWALYVLNKILGDDIFNNVIRSFLKKFREKEADFKEFQDITQEVSGRDLRGFFNKWIYGAESSNFLCKKVNLDYIIDNSIH
ncbi:peptidase family M1 [Clostridiales bacterium oral taxon 876 str. F0540]|nr:peptidase family M1 [Clostridiales bacterium oral taxon 876 str. F0540]